jgi:cytochrome c553
LIHQRLQLAPGIALLAVAMITWPAILRADAEAQRELRDAKRCQPDLQRGAQLFQHCVGCHGADGAGTADGRVPRIAGQHVSVLLEQLVDYRNDERWDPQMEHFADWTDLPDAQALADVAGYVRGLSGEPSGGQGNDARLRRGAERYTRLCLRCHGARGEGNSPRAIPRIAGQHFPYLERQIYDAVDGRRPNFSTAHIRLLARLDRDDIEAVAGYISHLGPGDARPTPAGQPH